MRGIGLALALSALLALTGCTRRQSPPAVAATAPPSADAAVIAACGGRASRSGNSLRLTVANGSPVLLTDSVDDKISVSLWNKYELAECADDLGLFVVRVHHDESQTQILVGYVYGEQFELAGPIHVSPSKPALVVVEPFPSGGEFWDFGIEVFHRLPNGTWNQTWQYRPTDHSKSEFLAWEGEDAVRISTATWKAGAIVTGRETVLRVSPTQFLRHDGPERILRDDKGRYVDHIPGEQ